ncbi:hypothetical protein MBLNU13_g03762t1 [Cladosporium sp. NU13]
MFVRNAAALFLTVGLLSKDALAELITITQYASTCSAIYTSGTRSTTIIQSATTTRLVTVVQSTTTVVPVPYDDAAWNGGTPFVLEIQPDAGTDPLARRADPAGRSWVSLDGSTSTNPSEAGQYYIRGGQLLSVNGSYVSTNLNVESEGFSVKKSPGSISTTFTFKDGVLNWTSPRFTGGRARFCKSPVTLVDNAQVLCQFVGSAQQPQTCTPVRLVAKPCEEVHPLSSSSVAPTGTISLSSSMGMQSMSSGGPPDQYTPPPYTTPGGSSSAVPSASTPPAPYISSSPSRSLPQLSTPAAYTSAQSSSVPYSGSPSATTARTSSSSPGASSSSAGPPVYGSQTPSPAPASRSLSSSSTISFASSGSPIGPINPPVYGSTSSDSSALSSSVSISSGGIRSSATSTSSASSSGQPPVYPSQTTSLSVLESGIPSSSVLLSSSSLVSRSSSISFVSSESRPPVYTPPAVTPSSTASSTASSSLSIFTPQYPSQSSPVVSPVGSSTSVSSSSRLSSSIVASSSTLQVPSSSSFQSPPIYTGAPPQPCPQGNNSVYVNAAGNVYTIYCNIDSSPASYQEPLILDFTACIQRCDFDPQCGAVSHTGTVGGNRCYLKPTPQIYVPGTTNMAVRLAGDPSYPGVSSSVSGVSSSSQVPPVYGSTSSSSVVQSPVSSSVLSSASSSMASSSMSSSISSSMVSNSMMSSISSSEVPSQYQGPTTTTTTTTTSSSSSSEVPVPYGSTTSSSVSSSSSSSVQIPDEYEQTTTTSTSSSSSEVPDQYEQTTTTTTTSSTSSPAPTTTTTTTPTSSSRSSSSSAASSTIPYSSYLVLPSPTPCDFGDPPDYDEDDSYCEVDLPFSIQLYGNSFTRTFASSNGYIGLNRGSSQFQVNPFPYSGIPENTIAPFFDDLFLYGRKQPRQGIYYQIDGGKVTFEWYVGRSAQAQPDKDRLSQSIYHFTMAYDSALPNTFVYTYYAVGKTSQDDGGVNGAYAAVGFQGLDGSGASRGTTYSIRNAQITPGTQISCSGTSNECTKVNNPIISITIPLGGTS